MLSSIPFELPLRFLPGLASGEIVRFGSILKDAATGRILGHLQESGVAHAALSQLLSSATSPVSFVSSVIHTGSSLYTALQVRQLKVLMETLQVLQVATLGVSLVGIGVSVAQFAYMRHRFNRLDGQMSALTDVVKAGFDQIEKRGLRQQLSRTSGLVQRAEIAGEMSDARTEYREIAAQLGDQAALFEGELAAQLKAGGQVAHGQFWLLVQLWMLCNSTRVDCLLRANEMRSAQRVAERIAQEYASHFEPIGPATFDVDHVAGRATVRLLRDATDAAHSKPYLLEDLRARRIDGPAYVDSLDRHADQPMLVLQAA